MSKFQTNDSRINRNGRPTLQSDVETWFLKNPNGSAMKCSKELGISRTTVIKWIPAQIKNKRLKEQQKKLAEKSPTKKEQIVHILQQPSKAKQIFGILKS